MRWESAGEGDYTIETVERAARGTDVILHLREGEDEFLDGWRLKSIIRKYSDHIQVPIVMVKEEWDEDKKADVLTDETEMVNQASALWARPKSRSPRSSTTSSTSTWPTTSSRRSAHVHAKVEGKQEYTQLLYLPAHAPFDLWDREHRHGIKLYVRRVFIMDDAEQLMPLYLRFVRGVIDSNDLPLNVSREILQHSRDVEAIRAGSVKKVLGLIEDLAENEKEKFTTFWSEFGRVFKEGVGEDFANRERIAKLLRFASTHTDTDEQTVSLADYVSRMKEGQDKIYYITADSFAAAKNSPHLEIFRKKGIEVLLMSDRVDEWVTSPPARVRRQAAAVGGEGRSRPGQARGRGGEEGAGTGSGRIEGAHRADREGAGRAGEGGARDASPDELARLPGGGPVRHERQSGAAAQGGRAEGACHQADPRDQPARTRWSNG